MRTSLSASATELELLWRAIERAQHLDAVSDGEKRWAFCIDFRKVRIVPEFDGFAGAVLEAEEGAGPCSAKLFFSARELWREWTKQLVSRS